MPQPFEVEVVRESASLAGPIFIGLGALAAAVITALTANWRHQKQLTHDRELHTKQLEQDRGLRREEFEHDRRMRQRENIRVVLDDVLADERVLRRAANDFFDELDEVEAKRINLEEEGASFEGVELDRLYEPVLKFRIELHKYLAEAHYDSVKLRVRMGNDPLVDAHESIANTIEKRLDGAEGEGWPVRTADQRETDRRNEELVDDAQTQFLVACANWHTS